MNNSKTLKDYPKLLAEWDFSKNGNKNPLFLTHGSNYKAWWKCSKGHEWQASISHRTNNSNCPYCSNKKVLKGFNDLATTFPVLAKEWDFEKNTLVPEEVVAGSKKEAWWICPNGHDSYKARIVYRKAGYGCPVCNKMFQTSFPEQAIFYYLKKAFPDCLNKYKEIFNNTMELDVYVPSIKVAIEYDGIAWHNSSKAENREKKKYEMCKANNIFLYRIKEELNNDNNADRVLCIPRFSYDKATPLENAIKTILSEISKDKIDINIDRDAFDIYSYRIIKYEDSLAYLHPEISKEWHPVLNKKLKPESTIPGTSLKVWWKCSKGHEWRSSVANRTKGHGCDICAREQRKITYHNLRLETRELLVGQKCLLDWDYSKNEHDPSYYTKGSGEHVWWKCHICAHEWNAAICDRTRDYKNGCPACSNRILVRGKNDLLTTNRDLVEKEWNYELNGDVKPYDVAQWSHDKVWWTCSKCGYSYEATPSNRVYGKGCGCCAGRVVVPGINDLATTRPDIAIDWHPTKNGDLKPTQVTKGRKDVIWWKCHVCGHEWQDSLNHRNRGRGCSVCKKNPKKK